MPSRVDGKRLHAKEYQQARSRWDFVLVRIDKEEMAALRAYAKLKRVTLASLVREAITWRLECLD